MSTERMNPEAWRQSVKYATKPTDEEFAGIDFLRDLLPAYEERKALWASIKSDLSDDEIKLLTGPIAEIDIRFSECDKYMIEEPDRHVPDDADHTYVRKDPIYFNAHSAGDLNPIPAYFHACEYPDMCVVYQMDIARGILEKATSQV